MSKSENQKNYSSSATHQSVQKSSTLNRKYVSRPTIRIEIDKIKEEAHAAPAVLAEESIPVEVDEPSIVPEEPLRSILQTPPENIIIERTKQIEIVDAFSEPEEDKIEDDVKNTTDIDVAEPADSPDLPPETHPYQRIIDEVAIKNSVSADADGETVPPPTPRELKNEAIKKALHQLDEQREEDAAVSKVIASEKKQARSEKHAKKQSKSKHTLSDSFKKNKRHSSVSKFILAFATSAACIGILGYFVSLNMPSISVRVAAMQTGIEAAYPSYVPRDYQLSGVSTGDNNTVTINFSGKDSDAFYISEEKSSWDSNALLNNYVKSEWGEDYTTLREQGVTIYIHNSDATWVNGGILYKLKTTGGSLSKKLIKNLALSL